MSGQFTHFDEAGKSRMVDVGEKPVTIRSATASGEVRMAVETWQAIQQSVGNHKGNVLEVARLAGIQAAKRTDELIPLCHSLGLDGVTIDFEFPAEGVLAIQATARVTARTGVEMEALTAVSVAALTMYDMCKSRDRGMTIGRIQLESKTGGRSGEWVRPTPDDEMRA
jgi:cyclic pyranopterin monophosphate synthase